MPRTSIVAALVALCGACFYDHAPRGTATQDASAGSTTTASGTTTGAVTSTATTDAATTAATTTDTTADATSTVTSTGDPTTGDVATSTSSASDPSTGGHGPTGEPGTTTAGREACLNTQDHVGCYQCCVDAHKPASLAYFLEVMNCVCNTEDGTCQMACIGDLCEKQVLGDACLTCLEANTDPCLDLATAKCQSDVECAAYLQCITESDCKAGP